jgi:nitroimidazol reductase NimA-like FMN-containing flavoprotein (pyridoxamine 5'-phosphate oxidase superfamily)
VTDAEVGPLSPTARTTLGRLAEKGRTDRAELHALLDTALVAHVGLDAGGYPLVLPTAFAVDLDGPDRDGTLYIHGSTAARWINAARGAKVCVTVTEVDGLVAARSGFESSMNYRTAVVLGEARVVEDADERQHALDLMVDHMVPGRAATIRRPTRKELAATQVLAVPLHEASLKVRQGGPDDEDDDIADNPWGGHIPLYRVAGAPVGDEGSRGPAPDDVRRRAEQLGASVEADS